MLTSEECFAIWAPEEVVWSAWAKPAAFAPLLGTLPTEPPMTKQALTVPGLPASWTNTAVVIDLPGDDAVRVGIALAEHGFRPVPLFNGTSGPRPVVDVELITWALGTGTALLSQTPLMSDARPAFLLDARRSTTLGAGEPGRYDNRWVVLPQDFPSAAFLLSRRIREVALIQHGFLSPAEDLSHVLVRWQHAGIRLRLIDLMTGEFEPNATLKQPSHFRRAWYVAIALRGLRRSTVGGFGSTIPEQTARSGFYG